MKKFWQTVKEYKANFDKELAFQRAARDVQTPTNVVVSSSMMQPLPSTTMDEETLTTLLKEAMILADKAHTPHEIKAAKFELQALKREFELREQEQVIYFQRLRMSKPQILEYQAAIHVCRTQAEQTLLEMEHREFML